MAAIILGLLSALSWGAGDFTGAVASRKAGAARTVMMAEFAGLLLLLAGLAVFPKPALSWWDWARCGGAGAAGALGLWALYQAMASGQMSLAAPVSGVTAAALPVVAGSLLEGLPSPWVYPAFALALVAIWLVSQTDQVGKSRQLRLASLGTPLFSGICFGFYFILMHQGSQDAVMWPIVAARVGGALTLAAILTLRKQAWLPQRTTWPLIAFSGALDVGGNLFFILAGQAGRLDTAAVLGSLYPGTTVLLAWRVLGERITPRQWAGILAALGAIVLLTQS